MWTGACGLGVCGLGTRLANMCVSLYCFLHFDIVACYTATWNDHERIKEFGSSSEGTGK